MKPFIVLIHDDYYLDKHAQHSGEVIAALDPRGLAEAISDLLSVEYVNEWKADAPNDRPLLVYSLEFFITMLNHIKRGEELLTRKYPDLSLYTSLPIVFHESSTAIVTPKRILVGETITFTHKYHFAKLDYQLVKDTVIVAGVERGIGEGIYNITMGEYTLEISDSDFEIRIA